MKKNCAYIVLIAAVLFTMCGCKSSSQDPNTAVTAIVDITTEPIVSATPAPVIPDVTVEPTPAPVTPEVTAEPSPVPVTPEVTAEPTPVPVTPEDIESLVPPPYMTDIG